MDYEKKYKEVLKKAKKELQACGSDNCDAARQIYRFFPELKESEDEKIRKALIKVFSNREKYLIDQSFGDITVSEALVWLEKQSKKDIQVIFPTFTFDDILALQCCMKTVEKVQKDEELYNQLKSLHDRLHDAYWLEKQGEQKPADEVEPKFKVGDWVVNNNGSPFSCGENTLQITDIEGEEIWLESKTWTTGESIHLWTIADAKDGDVLSNGEMIVIFKHFEEPSYRQRIVAYIGLDSGGDIQITDDTWKLGIDKAKPATKEQRDLLFQKMKEAGYEWDDEKKELRKTEQEMISEYNEHEPTSYEVEKWNEAYSKGYEIGYMNGKNEPKPAEWSKQSIIDALTKWLNEKIAPLHKKCLDGTITERDEMFQAALLHMRSFVNSPSFQVGKDISAEWSEEDEKMCQETIDWFEKKCFPYALESENPARESIKWLKSLKNRV